MEPIQWYFVGCGSVLGVCLLGRMRLYRPIAMSLRLLDLSSGRGRRWLCYIWPGYTIAELLFLFAFVGANTAILLYPFRGTNELAHRSAMAAVFNCIPLFLGGRTTVYGNFIGISLSSYRMAHDWIGRLVVAEAVIHVALASRRASRLLLLSGIQSTAAMGLSLLTSFWFIRGRRYFVPLHALLALLVLGGLVTHVSVAAASAKNRADATVAQAVAYGMAGVWFIHTAVRATRMARQRGRIIDTYDHHGVIELRVRLDRPRRHYPGCYYYLFLPDLSYRDMIHGRAAMAFSKSKSNDSVSFLVESPRSLAKRRQRLKRVVLDGPYGLDPGVQSFESVVLVAEGIGISGVLSLAAHLTQRWVEDRNLRKEKRGCRYLDVTRRVDILWKLRDIKQERFAATHLNKISRLDPECAFVRLRIYCGQTRPRPAGVLPPTESSLRPPRTHDGEQLAGTLPPMEPSLRPPRTQKVRDANKEKISDDDQITIEAVRESPGRWERLYPMGPEGLVDIERSLERHIEYVTQTAAGKSVVVACTYPGLARVIRNYVLRLPGVYFRELDRPDPGMQEPERRTVR